ncbi:MAG: hypothetical protein R2695_22265 [Acidimicrobiales bacterium]
MAQLLIDRIEAAGINVTGGAASGAQPDPAGRATLATVASRHDRRHRGSVPCSTGPPPRCCIARSGCEAAATASSTPHH